MENKVTKNYMYNLIYQILTILLPIITTPYLSRVLGPERIGIYGYTTSIVTYFTLIGALGVSKYGQREIAYVQNDLEARSKVFLELNIIKTCTLLLTSLAFWMVFCIKGEYAVYYRILILELVATFLDISWFFQGIEDFKKIVVRNSIIKIISVISIFLLVKDSEDLIKYFFIYVLSNFLGNGTLWINLRKYIIKVKLNFSELKSHIFPMISLFIPQIAVSIYTVLDKTMIGLLVSDISEVGYYEQSQKIIKIALTFVTTMSVVMLPRISNSFAKGDNAKIKHYMKKSFNFNWFLSIPIIFGILAISKNFVPWFYGDGYDKIVNLLVYSSPIILFIAFSTTIGTQYLVSVRKQNIQTIAVCTGALVNVVLNLILIPNFESEGAIITTVIAELVITLIESFYLIKYSDIMLKDMFDGAYKCILSGLIMFTCIHAIAELMPIGMMYTAIQVFIGVFIYIIILLVLKDKFIVDIIRNMIINRKVKFK